MRSIKRQIITLEKNFKDLNIKASIQSSLKNKIKQAYLEVTDSKLSFLNNSLVKYASNFQPLELFNPTQEIKDQWIRWDVTFNRLDYLLIPYINIIPIYRNILDDSDEIVFYDSRIGTVIEINDINDDKTTRIKTVTIHQLMYIWAGYNAELLGEGLTKQYEARLLITLPSPTMFV